MTVPKRVKIGHIPYKIVCDKNSMAHTQIDAGKGLLGQCDHVAQAINLNPAQARDSLADTLLHEILHGALSVSGCQLDAESEETFVAAATGPLLGVIRSQISVMAFLMGIERV